MLVSTELLSGPSTEQMQSREMTSILESTMLTTLMGVRHLTSPRWLEEM